MELTKEDIQAMRRATSASIHIEGTKAQVRLTEKIILSKRGIQVAHEIEHTIDIDGAIGRKGWSGERLGTKANAYISTCRLDGNWQALAQLVKRGDDLIVEALDNSNGYMRKAEIPAHKWIGEDYKHPYYPTVYHEIMVVSIIRNGKTVIAHLQLDESIAPDNSARMVRP